MGTPQELTDECGNVVWCNYEWAWGGRYTHFYKEQFLNDCAIIESDLQPIRFQGQFYDVETGLHYNRFRYYDSDVGMFIQRDPIGLLGGVNVFAYAPNPVGWVDPWGLIKKKNLSIRTIVNEKTGDVFILNPSKSYYYHSVNKRESVWSHIKNGHKKATDKPKGKYIGSDDEIIDLIIDTLKTGDVEKDRYGNPTKVTKNYPNHIGVDQNKNPTSKHRVSINKCTVKSSFPED